MTSLLTKTALRLLLLLLTVTLVMGVFAVVKNQGLLEPFGIESESHDSQVIQAVERTQEVSLLSLHIQGIKKAGQTRTIFGKEVPFSERTLFLMYKFNAKLGLDGAQVNVTKRGDNGYLVSVPEFRFIGFDEPTFEVATEDGSALSWATPEIDELQMVNGILKGDERQSYIASNRETLEEQTEVFYDRLITSIDPGAKTTFEFRT